MSKKSKYILIVVILAVIAFGFAFYRRGSNEKNGNNAVETPVSINENVEKKSDKINIFKHPSLSFSFEYLSNYNLSQLGDGAGETILVQKDGQGAQVYISDFLAEVVFNAQLVKQELAGEKMDNLKDISMFGGFPAVSFSSSDPSLGDTLEVWFVRGEKLYQITAQAGRGELLKTLAESWRFE